VHGDKLRDRDTVMMLTFATSTEDDAVVKYIADGCFLGLNRRHVMAEIALPLEGM
jgi:hypothetical protein